MAEEYVVEQGDSLTSIAFERGFSWETLWNHPRNAELKGLRKDQNIIYPGDVLHIPDKAVRFEQRPADARHKFVLKKTPDRLRIRLLKPYSLIIDGKILNRTTDDDGWVTEWISPGAKEGRLVIEGGEEEYEIALGYIDPIDTVSGLQGRLSNLGFLGGKVTGEMDDNTVRALNTFQAANDLPKTGIPDEATLNKLKSKYGS
jgi:N-acetylmuramoyl-L-alanine amidase